MMTPEVVMDLGHQALMLTVYLAAPLLLSALAVGLIVGIFQAATQIQEMTLSFIPKLMVLVLALVVGGPWMIRTIVEFTRRLYQDIPGLVG
jgi:flagellar biosynthetic protein FliQ